MATDSGTDALVLGAGVIGLTTAVSLLEAGFRVVVRASAGAPYVTSSVAAGLWFPYAVGGKDVPTSALATLHRYRELAGDSETGVRFMTCRSIVPPEEAKPFWASEDVDFIQTERGFEATLPVADSRLFLPWLAGRIERLGGKVVIDGKPVSNMDRLEAELIVNCTGLGARDLVEDDKMYPIRGVVLLVENPGIDYCLTDNADSALPTYVIPVSAGLVLGGTADVGASHTAVSREEKASILRRCEALEPELRGVRVVVAKAGLRPGRDEIRIEVEKTVGGKTVIHNYGHGGSGFTLAWGSAQEVVRLVLDAS